MWVKHFLSPHPQFIPSSAFSHPRGLDFLHFHNNLILFIRFTRVFGHENIKTLFWTTLFFPFCLHDGQKGTFLRGEGDWDRLSPPVYMSKKPFLAEVWLFYHIMCEKCGFPQTIWMDIIFSPKNMCIHLIEIS